MLVWSLGGVLHSWCLLAIFMTEIPLWDICYRMYVMCLCMCKLCVYRVRIFLLCTLGCDTVCCSVMAGHVHDNDLMMKVMNQTHVLLLSANT